MKKLYTESSVANIARGLRLKLDGKDESFTLSQMEGGVLSLPYSNIPVYHYNEAGRLIKSILSFKERCPDSLVFGAISDTHVFDGDAVYDEETKRGIRHASFALETVGAMAGCDFIVNLGDNVWENGIDTDGAYRGHLYVNDAIKAGFDRLLSYRLLGNHDRSEQTEKTYDIVGSFNDFDSVGHSPIRGFGYKDLQEKKIRLICLNTTDYMNIAGGCALSYDQKDFLIRALDLSDKEDFTQWRILLLSHIPLDYSQGDYNFTSDLRAILKGYQDGSAVSIFVNPAYCANENPSVYPTYENGCLVYNYAGKNKAKIIANVHGHVHNNSYGKMPETGILRMSTPNACFYQNTPESILPEYNITAEEGQKLKKYADCEKNTSATFYCIDLKGDIIYALGYGANTDRTATYSDKALFSVTYDLTDCYCSTDTAAILEGSQFTAVISSENGLESVTVTMGNADVTSSCYNDGTVSISNVTGDITITAKGAEAFFEHIVPDLSAAVRQTCYIKDGALAPQAANTRLVLTCSTDNGHGWVSRESKNVFIIPVPEKAKRISLTTTDPNIQKFNVLGINYKDSSYEEVYNSGWSEDFFLDLPAHTDYVVVNLMYTDDIAQVPWGYDVNAYNTLKFN